MRPSKAPAETENLGDFRPEYFRSTRLAHQTEVLEDYVELIDDLLDRQGEARITDLAARLGVTLPTVAKSVARLEREGLVDTRPYRAIQLTTRGRDLARHVKRRHEMVVEFLRC